MFNNQNPMTNVQLNHNDANPKRYDLSERTIRFSQSIIDFCKSLANNAITSPLINQLIRSGTSIGANYHEADEGSSKKDFVNKIAIANKEAKETKYWLQVIAHADPQCKTQARILWKEAHELNLIFSAIIRNSKK
jgi:four helix bundle protein